MKKHVKINHESSREFKCNLCSKQFVSTYYMKRHLLTVHRVSVVFILKTYELNKIRGCHVSIKLVVQSILVINDVN